MRSSLELRLAVAAAALCLVGALVGAWIAAASYARAAEDAALSSVRGAARAFDARERSEIEKLAATLDGLQGDAALVDAFLARDRERLLEATAPRLATMRDRDRITHWYFIAPDRTVFLRVHAPTLRGDPVERFTLRRAAETGDVGAGKELGKTAFALRVVRPWYRDGRLVGFMELAEEIDHFLGGMRADTGDEYGLLVDKRELDEAEWNRVMGPRGHTWNDRPDVVVVDATPLVEGIEAFDGGVAGVPEGGRLLGEDTRRGRSYVRAVFPVRDASGRQVAGLFVEHDVTDDVAGLRVASRRATLALLAVGLAVAAAVALAAHRLVFAPLRRLRRRLEDRAEAERLPPGRVLSVVDDDVGRLEALLDRALFPASPAGPRPDEARERSGCGS